MKGSEKDWRHINGVLTRCDYLTKGSSYSRAIDCNILFCIVFPSCRCIHSKSLLRSARCQFQYECTHHNNHNMKKKDSLKSRLKNLAHPEPE